MNFFLFVIAFLLIFLTVIVIIVLAFIRRGVKKIKQAVTGDYDDEETFRRMADKHYRGKSGDPQFDKDYFKSSTGSTTTDGKQRTGQQKTWGQQQQQTRRTTTTREGVTIIDERSQSNQRKIFAEDEGEYVEFEES
jgi:hypothetical protein